jgi:anaerobic dimethyl sulfoxide reductase subunit B (iron-sulfur subunit)
MKMILDLDTDLCVGCGACVVACMDQNDIDVEAALKPFRVVSTLELPQESRINCVHLTMACMHCDDPPCIKACPCACIKKDAETGFTVFDTAGCIGCRNCAMACPFGAPGFEEEGKMLKCDGCVDRVRQGLKPACVRICPFDALNLYSEEEYKNVHTRKSMQKIAKIVVDD